MDKIKILIVDDHPAMRHGIAQLLEKEDDFEVCAEAGNRLETIDAATKYNPNFIILDIGLKDSDVDGLDLIPELININGGINILVYSMYDENVYAERALRSGAKGYLMKQESVKMIVIAIRHIIQEGIYISDEIGRKMLLRQIGDVYKTDNSISPKDNLSEREYEIFRFIGQGCQPREIASTLCLSVETHRRNIRKKLHISDASHLTRSAIEWVHK